MRFVVGISGASGIILAKKTIEALLHLGHGVECTMTPNACYTAALEMGEEYGSPKKFIGQLPVKIHGSSDAAAGICSGSYRMDGMIVVPCSMASLAAISYGISDNTLRRAADVTLKEKRPLVLVPRESPFSAIHLENMMRLANMGALIVPPIPGWYTQPKTLEDVENFIVGRILDALHIDHQLYPRWQ